MSLTPSYTPDVPQGNQQINNTQQPININFQDISELIGINHVNFNTANFFGEHSLLTYYQQSADPTTASNEIALYSKPTTGSQSAQLFYRYPNDGSVVQLTGQATTTSSGSGGAQYINANVNGQIYYVLGYQYLTNGLIMKWGLSQFTPTTGTSPQTFTLPIPIYGTIPNFTTAIYNYQISSNSSGGSSGTYTAPAPQGMIYVIPDSLTSFQVSMNPTVYSGTTYRTIFVNWLLIGV
jgi:hypothetical protein